jgi:hypothetical protein
MFGNMSGSQKVSESVRICVFVCVHMVLGNGFVSAAQALPVAIMIKSEFTQVVA